MISKEENEIIAAVQQQQEAARPIIYNAIKKINASNDGFLGVVAALLGAAAFQFIVYNIWMAHFNKMPEISDAEMRKRFIRFAQDIWDDGAF